MNFVCSKIEQLRLKGMVALFEEHKSSVLQVGKTAAQHIQKYVEFYDNSRLALINDNYYDLN